MEKCSISQQEDALFQGWPDGDSDLFCPDGLHRTGYPSKESGCWQMVSDEQAENRWMNSKIRCLFLTKDHNLQGDQEGVDVRCETGKDNTNDRVFYRFYARYLMLLYGLTRINLTTFTYPSLDEAKNPSNYLCHFYKTPVVCVNVKKIGGESTCSQKTLSSYLTKDKDKIIKQLHIYDANVIIVCQGEPWNPSRNQNDLCHILDLVYEMYPDLRPWKGCRVRW